jgi:hypothetical protein
MLACQAAAGPLRFSTELSLDLAEDLTQYRHLAKHVEEVIAFSNFVGAV